MNNQALLPPYSENCETAILGCIMLDPKASVPRCLQELVGNDTSFYDLKNRTVYNHMLALYSEGKGIDVITLRERLNASKELDRVGGVGFLSSLPEMVPSAANIDYYIETVNHKFLGRKMIQLGTEMRERGMTANGNTPELISEFQRRMLDLAPNRSKALLTIKEVVEQTQDLIERLVRDDESLAGWPTGLVDLDRLCEGLKPQEMTVIAGYPGSGKTSLAMNIAEHAIVNLKKSVAIFSLEMSGKQLMRRMIFSSARVNLADFKRHESTEQALWTRLAFAAAAIRSSKAWIAEYTPDILELVSHARLLKQQHGLDLVVIDYVQLLSVGGKRGGQVQNRQQEVSEISRHIRLMTKELDVRVLALSQLNDEGKLRESRALGQDADNVWILNLQRDPNDVDQWKKVEPVDLIIDKARSGSRGRVPLIFHKPHVRFECPARTLPVPSRSHPYNDD